MYPGEDCCPIHICMLRTNKNIVYKTKIVCDLSMLLNMPNYIDRKTLSFKRDKFRRV